MMNWQAAAEPDMQHVHLVQVRLMTAIQFWFRTKHAWLQCDMDTSGHPLMAFGRITPAMGAQPGPAEHGPLSLP